MGLLKAALFTFVLLGSATHLESQVTTTNSPATQISITDSKGNVVELLHPRFDYTNYSFIYTTDLSYTGIRAYQGDGIVTIAWARIDSITISGKTSDTFPFRLQGELLMKDGTRRTVQFVVPNAKGLLGVTDLGEFSIALENVKSIKVLSAVAQ